jgi:hypothetical protein
VLGRDAGFRQRVEDGGQVGRGGAVGMLFFQRGDDQAAGALGLPAGQQVRAVFPAGDDAEADAVGLGEVGEGLVHPGEVRGAVVGQGEQHAGEQGADLQLARAGAGGQHRLDRPGDPRAVDDLLKAGERDWRAHRVPPSRATARVSPAG